MGRVSIKKISVVIPAHNEEKYVRRCIRSVRKSAEECGRETEIIVVCNRCTDRTAELAVKSGARVVYNEDRCIARVRNAGIAAAVGDMIVTIDCDNRMTPGTLGEAVRLLECGRYIGGGAPIRFERYSLPLFLNDIMCAAGFKATGSGAVSSGLRKAPLTLSAALRTSGLWRTRRPLKRSGLTAGGWAGGTAV